MKRIFITLVAVLACVFNANAQFVVDSLGKVSVGEETDPQSQVYVLDKANEFTRNVTVQKGAQFVIKQSDIRK